MMGFNLGARKRRMRLGSYAALLVAMLVYLVLAAALQEKDTRMPWITGLLFPVIMFATIVSATETRKQLVGLVALVAIGFAIDILNQKDDALAIEVMRHSVHIVFLILTIVVILRHVFRDASVGADMILGAVCAYLLLGLAFNQLFSLVEILNPGSFAGEITVQHDGGYFSLVTLSTLGYGDIVPVRAYARSLAAIEAVIGQFYIAVIVARLVALQMIQARPRSPSGSQEAS